MAYCIKCGSQLRENGLFCTQCGTKAEAPTVTPSTSQIDTQRHYAYSQQSTPANSQLIRKLLIGIAASICILIGILIMMPTPQTSKSMGQENPEKNNYNENNILHIENKEEIMLPLPLPMLPENWRRIYIDNIGTLDIPPTMEIQSGLYKEIIDPLKPELMKSMGIISNVDNNIIIQQNGLNDLNNSGFQKYARIIINTYIGDFDTLYFDTDEYSISDINELDNSFRSSIISTFIGTGLKLIHWYPLKIEVINGMSCIHISYTRQLNNNPIVFVNLYQFENTDRKHTLTLSYRQNESEYWNNDFSTVLKSFRIENIK